MPTAARRLVSIVPVALLAATAVTAGASPGHRSVARTYVTQATGHLRAGGTLHVRATRLSASRVRVTTILRVRIVRRTSVGWVAGICTTGGGCIDRGSRATTFAARGPGTYRLQRTLTLTRTAPGKVGCVTVSPEDLGPGPTPATELIGLDGGTRNGAHLCP